MAEKWTKKAALDYFNGATPRNLRWSWSARSPNDGTVVLILWKDQISHDGNTVVYQSSGKPGRPKYGNRERIDNLIWARDHRDGLFRVVMATARDTKARPRRIAKCHPEKTLVMKLISLSLDEHTGAFRAESMSR